MICSAESDLGHLRKELDSPKLETQRRNNVPLASAASADESLGEFDGQPWNRRLPKVGVPRSRTYRTRMALPCIDESLPGHGRTRPQQRKDTASRGIRRAHRELSPRCWRGVSSAMVAQPEWRHQQPKSSARAIEERPLSPRRRGVPVSDPGAILATVPMAVFDPHGRCFLGSTFQWPQCYPSCPR